MSFTVYERDANSVLDFMWDWSAWLQVSEVISSHTINSPVGITIDSSSHTNTTVTAWVSGGTTGTAYDVTCRITTNQGRTEDRTIRLMTKEK